MQIVIIAGGLATRLGELSKNTPKSMIRIKDKPFLEYQLDFLRKAKITDIVLCLGHKGDQIAEYFGDGSRFGVSLRYSFEKTQLGTAGALKNAETMLDDIFLTMYGDSYVFLDFDRLIERFTSGNTTAMMTVFRNEGKYDNSNVSIADGKVVKYSKTDITDDMVYIDYGVNAFRKRVVDMVPEKLPYALEEVFPRLIRNQDLLAFETETRFYEIGSPSGLQDFSNYIKDNS